MQNSYIFIQEQAFENVACEMLAILSGPQCLKAIWLLSYPISLGYGNFVFCSIFSAFIPWVFYMYIILLVIRYKEFAP